jgi:hypothetical protein
MGFMPTAPLRTQNFTSFRLARSDLVEVYAGGLERIERFLLQLQWARPFRGAREGASGNRPVILALGLLQGVQRRRVLVLPLEPSRQALHRIRRRRARTFNPVAIAILPADGMRDPLSVELDGSEIEMPIADRDVLEKGHRGRTS